MSPLNNNKTKQYEMANIAIATCWLKNSQELKHCDDAE